LYLEKNPQKYLQKKCDHHLGRDQYSGNSFFIRPLLKKLAFLASKWGPILPSSHAIRTYGKKIIYSSYVPTYFIKKKL